MLLALEQLFLHEGGTFLDEGRFQQLLPALVAQLHGVPPPEHAAPLAALLPPPLLVARAGATAAMLDAAEDPFGAAAVAALSSMAAAAGSDVMYRPLNRAVRWRSASDVGNAVG